MTPDVLLARTQRDTFWVPDDVTVTARPELCFLSCPRDIAGLNQVMHCAGPAEALPALVDEVATAHAGRHSRFHVGPLFPAEDLAPVLRAAGYTPGHRHHGAVLRVEDAPPPAAPGIEARPVETLDDLRAWVHVASAAFDQPADDSEADLRRFLADCTGPDARVHRVVAWDTATGAPLSAGGITAFEGPDFGAPDFGDAGSGDAGFGFLWAGGTVPAARGRGAYRAVLGARAAWAASRGLSMVGLYAREGTSGPVVWKLGFDKLAPMVIWDRPAR